MAIVDLDLTGIRGDTLVFPILNIGVLTSRTKLWFTAKSSSRDLDTQAIIQIEETANLITLNGMPAKTATDGTLVVNDIPTGDVTLTLKPAATQYLEDTQYQCDIQVLIGGVITTLAKGLLTITSDITRAIS